MFYRIGDLTIATTLVLPGLAHGHRRQGSWEVRLAKAREIPNDGAWYHQWRHPGQRRPWMSVARIGAAHLIQFPGVGRFLIDDRRRLVLGRADATGSRDAFIRLLTGHVLPLLLASAGRLALHASAVATTRGVVAFVGSTGSGKSTLATFLARSHSRLIADDCLLLRVGRNSCCAVPVHAGLRLWPAQVSELLGRTGTRGTRRERKKRLLDPQMVGLAIGRQAAALRRIYLLSQPRRGKRGVSIVPVAARDGVIELIGALFQVGFDEPAGLRETFGLLTDLVARVPVRRLEYPRTPDALPRVERALMADLAEAKVL